MLFRSMSWTKRITRASDVLMIGEEVEAIILDIQEETRKISLGLRQTQDNPWEVIARDYPVGSIVKGKVRNLTTYGAFVEIKDDIDGMIHISDMSWTKKVNNPAEVLKKGDEVEAKIANVDRKTRQISLSVRAMEEAEEKEALRNLNEASADEGGGGPTTIGELIKAQMEGRE